MTKKTLLAQPETSNGRPWRKVRNPRIRKMHADVDSLDLTLRERRDRELYRMLVDLRAQAQAAHDRLERKLQVDAMARVIFGGAR